VASAISYISGMFSSKASLCDSSGDSRLQDQFPVGAHCALHIVPTGNNRGRGPRGLTNGVFTDNPHTPPTLLPLMKQEMQISINTFHNPQQSFFMEREMIKTVKYSPNKFYLSEHEMQIYQ
jgi:hypothetical protein